MLPSFHLSVTFILWYLLTQLIEIKTPFLLLTMIVSGVLVDMDALIIKGHRKSPFHGLPFWIVVSLALCLIDPIKGLALFISYMAHLISDFIDWEIYPFFPISGKVFGLKIVKKRNPLDPEKDSILSFVIANLRHEKLLVFEIFVDSLALLLFADSIIKYGFFNLLWL